MSISLRMRVPTDIACSLLLEQMQPINFSSVNLLSNRPSEYEMVLPAVIFLTANRLLPEFILLYLSTLDGLGSCCKGETFKLDNFIPNPFCYNGKSTR